MVKPDNWNALATDFPPAFGTSRSSLPPVGSLGASDGWRGVCQDPSPAVGNDAYAWNWNTCSKDTEAEDGIGLPGNHGCGSKSVPASAVYLG